MKDTIPLLSIIIPLYNGKQYIEETVKSLLKISCRKEIIIIDDGSVDGSFEYCEDHFKNECDVKVFCKSNGGIVDARNYGLNLATGDYLLFCDHDDIVFPEVIDKAIKIASEREIDIVFWSTLYLFEDGKYGPRDIVSDNILLNRQDIKTYLIEEMLTNSNNTYVSYIGHVWSAIYRREMISANGVIFKRFVDIEDDYLFVLDSLIIAKTVYLMKEYGYAWRYNLASETYRDKYIDSLINKYTNLYEYIDHQISKVKLDEKKIEAYEIYKKQEIVIRCIENICTLSHQSRKEKYEIKEFYCRNKKVFRNKNIYNYEKKRKRIFNLLKHGMFELACDYNYFDSVYRNFYRKHASLNKKMIK